MANPPKKPTKSVLQQAAETRDRAKAFVDKYSKGVNKDYRTAKAAYNREAAKVDAAYETLSQAKIFNDVSDAEVNATLRGLGIHPTTGKSQPLSRGAPARPVSNNRFTQVTPTSRKANNALNQATDLLRKTEAGLAKQESAIQKGYEQVNREFDALNRQLGRVQDTLSRRLAGNVSQADIDALMNEMKDEVRLEQRYQKPKVNPAASQPGKQPKLPSVPAHSVSSPAPNPNKTKIDLLEKQKQQFTAQRKALSSATNTSDYMPKLKAAVALIDKTYNTHSMSHDKGYNKLEARFHQLQKQVAEMKTVYQRNPRSKDLSARQEKFKKENASFKQDLKAYTERVAKVCDQHIAKCNKDIAGLKTGAAQDQNHSANNTPRPR